MTRSISLPAPTRNYTVMVWTDGHTGPRPIDRTFDKKAQAAAFAATLTSGRVYLWDDQRVDFCEVWDSHGYATWRHGQPPARPQW